jgi:hypothetical protein
MAKSDHRREPNGTLSDAMRDDVAIAIARALMAAPGAFMIGASLIMFLTSFVGLYATFGMEADVEVEVMKWLKVRVNDRWAADLERRIVEREASDKTVEHAIRAGYIVLGFIANGFVLLAGLRMRVLKNYGLCLAGSIIAIILNGCSCVGLPVGIWAFFALLRSDVKMGFEAVAKTYRPV